MTLFRQQAIDASKQFAASDVLLLPRISHVLLTTLVAAWLLMTLLWLWHASYATKQVLSGWLEPEGGATRVYAEGRGFISRVLVEEGAHVKAGQPLMLISAGQAMSGGETLEQRLIARLTDQRSLLNQRADRLARQFDQHLQALDTLAGQHTSDRELVHKQLVVMERRVALSSRQLSRSRQIAAAGYLPAARKDDREAAHLALQSGYAELQRVAVHVEQRLSELAARRLELIAEHDRQVEEARLRVDELLQRDLQLGGLASRVIVAPVSGVVHNLQVVPGQAVGNAGTPVLTLSPEDAELVVWLLLPVSSGGHVQPGMELRLRYDAFPYQHFGVQHARVEQISSTVLLPGELNHAGVPVNAPVYRVLARFSNNEESARWQSRLRPGLTLRADIDGTRRSLLARLAAPLRGIRERW